MRIAVTGGLGFIGSFLVDRLLKEGHEVVAIDIRPGRITGSSELYVADVTNLNQMLHALSEVDVVYHLAGTVLDVARKNPYLAANLDIQGTLNVLEACVRNGVQKIMYASSFYVYDGLPNNITVDEQYRSTIFNAEMFGVVKLMGERLVKEYNQNFALDYVILRYGPVYGPHERCSCVVYEFIKEGLKGNPIVIWGRGERKNQYTYVEDIVDGSVKALRTSNETFNLISPERLRIREIAELLQRKYGFDVSFDLKKLEGPSMPYISSKKAMEKLDWKPVSLEKGIELTIEVLRQRQITS